MSTPSDLDAATSAIARIIHDGLCTCSDFEAHLAKQVQGDWIPDLARRAIDAARPAIVAETRKAERQHITTRLRIMAENFADDKAAYAVLRRAADLLDGGDDAAP